MSVPSHEIIVEDGEIVGERWLSSSERRRVANKRFKTSLEEVGLKMRAVRDFCIGKLELDILDLRQIKTREVASLFLLSESRCPTDGAKLVYSLVPEESKWVCSHPNPDHGRQWGFRLSEKGEMVAQYPFAALNSISAGLFYPNEKGLSVIKEMMQQSRA